MNTYLSDMFTTYIVLLLDDQKVAGSPKGCKLLSKIKPMTIYEINDQFRELVQCLTAGGSQSR